MRPLWCKHINIHHTYLFINLWTTPKSCSGGQDRRLFHTPGPGNRRGSGCNRSYPPEKFAKNVWQSSMEKVVQIRRKKWRFKAPTEAPPVVFVSVRVLHNQRDLSSCPSTNRSTLKAFYILGNCIFDSAVTLFSIQNSRDNPGELESKGPGESPRTWPIKGNRAVLFVVVTSEAVAFITSG